MDDLDSVNAQIADLRANKELPREEVGRRLERLYRDKQKIIDQQHESEFKWQSLAAKNLLKLRARR